METLTPKEIAIEKRFHDLEMSFFIQNSLLLKNGHCACISCQKQFLNAEFLQIHFNKVHQQQIQALHEKAEVDINAGFPTPLQRIHKDAPHFEVLESEEVSEENQETALQRAEKRAYADLVNEETTISYEPYIESRAEAYL